MNWGKVPRAATQTVVKGLLVAGNYSNEHAIDQAGKPFFFCPWPENIAYVVRLDPWLLCQEGVPQWHCPKWFIVHLLVKRHLASPLLASWPTQGRTSCRSHRVSKLWKSKWYPPTATPLCLCLSLGLSVVIRSSQTSGSLHPLLPWWTAAFVL